MSSHYSLAALLDGEPLGALAVDPLAALRAPILGRVDTFTVLLAIHPLAIVLTTVRPTQIVLQKLETSSIALFRRHKMENLSKIVISRQPAYSSF